MVSQLVFNPQSLMSKKEYDEEIAREAMDALIDFIKTINDHQIPIKMIRSKKHMGKQDFMQGYSFIKWVKKFTRKQSESVSVLNFLVNKKSKVEVPAWIGLSDSEERIGKDYCFNDKTWALAYFFDFVLFSLHTETRWNTVLFECEYFDLSGDDEDTHTAIVRHASQGDHILQHRRLYYCHPKHCHDLPHTGPRDTEMDLSDSEAEKVLNQAVQIPTKKQLIGYSKKTQNLYEFQPEFPPSDKPFLGDHNTYHGYPIEPEELHVDVGGTVYREIVESLAERAVIDTDTKKRLSLYR
jgi:hypothetical protein